MLVSPEAPGVKPPAPGAFPFSFNRRLGIGPRIQHAVHRPTEPLAHILGAATGRLRSSGVVHLAARRIRRNQAVVDARGVCRRADQGEVCRSRRTSL